MEGLKPPTPGAAPLPYLYLFDSYTFLTPLTIGFRGCVKIADIFRTEQLVKQKQRERLQVTFEFQSKDIKKSSKMSAKDEKKAVDLGLLDEDDEFEEFPAEGKCRLAYNQIIYCQCRSWTFLILHKL